MGLIDYDTDAVELLLNPSTAYSARLDKYSTSIGLSVFGMKWSLSVSIAEPDMGDVAPVEVAPILVAVNPCEDCLGVSDLIVCPCRSKTVGTQLLRKNSDRTLDLSGIFTAIDTLFTAEAAGRLPILEHQLASNAFGSLVSEWALGVLAVPLSGDFFDATEKYSKSFWGGASSILDPIWAQIKTYPLNYMTLPEFEVE